MIRSKRAARAELLREGSNTRCSRRVWKDRTPRLEQPLQPRGSRAAAHEASLQTLLCYSASRSRTVISGRHTHTHHVHFWETLASSYHRPAPTASPRHRSCATASLAADSDSNMEGPRQRPGDNQSPPPLSVCVSDWICLETRVSDWTELQVLPLE